MTNPINALTDAQKSAILTAIWLMSRRTAITGSAIDTMLAVYTKTDGAKAPDAREREWSNDVADNTPQSREDELVLVRGIGIMSRRRAGENYIATRYFDRQISEAYLNAWSGPSYM